MRLARLEAGGYEVTKALIPAISSGPFEATPTGLVVRQKDVPIELWEAYGEGLKRVEGAIQWVIGDWLNYGEAKYGETYSQAMELWPEAEYQNLSRWKVTAENVSSRLESLSFEHHYEVRNLDPADQKRWLSRAEAKTWTVRELRQAIREGNPPQIPEAPKGKYSVIAIDPPWPYGTAYDEDGRRSASPYPEMPLEQIAAMKLPSAPDCVLWLWTTHKFMRESFAILDGWGFRDVAIVTWVKDRMGLGTWLRSQSEFCIMAVKGKPHNTLTNQTTVIRGPMREHSRKPDEFYQLAESLWPDAKRIDYFSREKRPGWDQYGNDPAKF